MIVIVSHPKMNKLEDDRDAYVGLTWLTAILFGLSIVLMARVGWEIDDLSLSGQAPVITLGITAIVAAVACGYFTERALKARKVLREARTRMFYGLLARK